MSNLVDHARRELTLLGEDEDTIEGMCKVVQAFADMGHSGGSASVLIPVLNDLLQYKNLKPLTDDPDEWFDQSESSGYPLWQNKRNSACFSQDGGQTYWIVDEEPNSKGNRPTYTPEHKVVE